MTINELVIHLQQEVADGHGECVVNYIDTVCQFSKTGKHDRVQLTPDPSPRRSRTVVTFNIRVIENEPTVPTTSGQDS